MNNEKGLTLVELFAAILLVSLVILPTLTALTGNFRVNASMMDRSTASTKATQTIQGFQNLHFSDLDFKLGDNHYLVFNENQGCQLLREEPFTPPNDIVTYTNNQLACNAIFKTTINNFEFNEDNFNVYIYPYAVDDEEAKTDFILGIENSDLPQDVKDTMINNISTGRSLRVLRIIVNIEYDTNQTVLRTGLITPRVEVRPE